MTAKPEQTAAANPAHSATPTPWVARGESLNAHRSHVCGGYNEESVFAFTRQPEERAANALRAAACVNGCAGIADPERDVPAMVAALRGLTDSVKFFGDHGVAFVSADQAYKVRELRDAARAVLARVEKGQTP